jgi:hypothetical protein
MRQAVAEIGLELVDADAFHAEDLEMVVASAIGSTRIRRAIGQWIPLALIAVTSA